jgi:hypothetical protein
MDKKDDQVPRDPDTYASRRLSSVGGTISGLFSDTGTGAQSWLSYLVGLIIAGGVIFLIGLLLVSLAH